MRLDKFISAATVYSRSEAKKLIKANRVQIDENFIQDPSYHFDTTCAQILIDGKRITLPHNRYIMLHKPAGVVCTNHDSEHPTVLDLLDLANKQQLQIVGRLDKDTTGLVLITDDGQWNHRVTAPNRFCHKHYRVCLEKPLDSSIIETFTHGVILKGEAKPTRPAQLTVISPTQAELAIQEGRYHQVKRMFSTVGNRVVALHRFKIGNLLLDPELAEGSYRHLSIKEVHGFDR